jgi:hypothetical protein
MAFGIDYKAAGKFTKAILDTHPGGWGAGGFTKLNGFGDALPTFRRLLETKKCPFMRLDLSWSDTHNYDDKFKPIVKAEAKRSRDLIELFPDVCFWVNPVTEHKLSERQWLQFANIVELELKGLSNVSLVNVPMVRAGFVSKEFLNEYHGEEKTPRKGGQFAFSFDGTNCVDSDVEAYKAAYKDGHYFFFWNSQCNGKFKVNDVIAREKRIAYPVPRQLNSWKFLASERGSIKLPKDWLYKSHADQHYVPPKGKDQKPLFITPPKTKPDFLSLVTKTGKLVAKSAPPVSFDDKLTGKLLGWRYYFADWGFLLAEKAKKLSNERVCNILMNGRVVGKVNPGFRSGGFR